MLQLETVQKAKDYLTAENTIEITTDSQDRDHKQYEKNTDTDADYAVQQTDTGFSHSVEYACQGCIQIQKRTDICHGMYINSCSLAVKQKNPEKFSQKQKKDHAKSTKQQTIPINFPNHILYPFFISQSLQFCN